MDSNSWLLLEEQDPRYRLPDDLRDRDELQGRDCGWVEQMRPFVQHFTQPGETVLDPFAGFGSTLLAAYLEGRPSIGIELNASRTALARERLTRHRAHDAHMHEGDVRTLHAQLPPCALCLTNLPYFGAPSGSEANPNQLYGLLHYDVFLEQLHDIFSAVHKTMAPGGHVVVMVQNLKLGDRAVPMAWDAARVLSGIFVAREERILLYRKPTQALAAQEWLSNRSHEYALVFGIQRELLDIDEALPVLQAMRAAGYAFLVYGGLARWLAGDHSRAPSDADLLVNFDQATLDGVLGFLHRCGFSLHCWQQPLHLPVDLDALRDRHYVRAERLSREGKRIVVDVAFRPDGIDIPVTNTASGLPCFVHTLMRGLFDSDRNFFNRE
jgi:hypothetical protein